MPHAALSARAPFDRFWRPGQPYRSRAVGPRRYCMLGLFVLLCSLIGGYWYLTDSNRVRGMAVTYLSNLLGARVEVGRATLSVFEGLRLDNVRVDLPDAAAGTTTAPAVRRPPIFTADTFLVRYDLRRMLTGRLEATQIVAQRPHVRLTENLDSLMAKYRRAMDAPPGEPARPEQPGGRVPPLPQILLRDARIDYSETTPGGRVVPLGSMAIEGQFYAAAARREYLFEAQSRGLSQQMGPNVTGSVDLNAGRVTARLSNFEFGRDIRLMLPAAVRRWWQQHDLSGKVDITALTYDLPARGGAGAFSIMTKLADVTLSVRPEELMSSDEASRLDVLRRTMAGLNVAYAATAAHPRGGATPADAVLRMFHSAPVRLTNVDGTLVFTDGGIAVQDVAGQVEGNTIHLAGSIDGYPGVGAGAPEPPARIRVTSGAAPVRLAPDPPYANAMPKPVREFFADLSPHGACTLNVVVARATAGGRIVVTGTVDVLDGQFAFIKFPYPVRNAKGKVVFAAADGEVPERVELNLSGNGIAGGPNADTRVALTGIIGPLGLNSGVAIRVKGDDIRSEPALRDAFPNDVQRTLRLFDAAGAGELPRFTGGFTCDINREIGPDKPIRVFTDVRIDRATAALAAFPYPLEDLSMRLRIGDHRVDIAGATMRRGDAELRVDGSVVWGPDVSVRDAGATAASSHAGGGGGGVRPAAQASRTELKLSARSLPIDRDLLAALPPDRQAWLRKLGVGGTLDLDGVVTGDTNLVATPGKPAAAVAYDLAATLKGGTVWPAAGTFVLSDVTAAMRLTPERVEVKHLRGRRGDGTVTLTGTVGMPPATGDATATVACAGADLTVEATKLPLDAALYARLPAFARQAWDAVRPSGTADVSLTYAGPVDARGGTAAAGDRDTPATAPAAFTATIRPRGTRINVRAAPYPLELTGGAITLGDGACVLSDVTARRGDATFTIAGRGAAARGEWDLRLAGANVPVDAALRAAVPPALASLLETIGFTGPLDFDFARLSIRPARPAAAPGEAVASAAPVAPPPPTAAASPATTDIDLTGTIATRGASLDVGVPLADVTGTLSLDAAVRGGSLETVTGSIAAESMTVVGRPLRDLRATLAKPAGKAELRLTDVRAALADGELAGSATATYDDAPAAAAPVPHKPAGRFAVDLVVRNADAATVAQWTDPKKPLRGRLSASLALEGSLTNPADRRGRGDMLAVGKEMYELPLILGLAQITNLALPITTPFTRATARYSVDGRQVTFEEIHVRGDTLLLTGNGRLDFDTKRVALTFTTDNPNAVQIPFISELWRGAQQELLRINVRGTIEEPKVSAAPMGTFRTTIDEVLNGDAAQRR